MAKASENIFPKVRMSTTVSSAAPSGGEWRLESRANGIYAVSSNTGSAGTGPFGAGGAGAVATDVIWTTAGKVAIATGTATATEQWPPGRRFDYVQRTTDLSVTATTEGTAQVLVTGASVTYDGSTMLRIQTGASGFSPNAAGGDIRVIVYDNTAAAVVACVSYSAVGAGAIPMGGECFVTPAAGARVYSIRSYVSTGTGNIYAAVGSIPSAVPSFMEITKV